MNALKKILIAYDGSEPANLAIDDLCRAGLPEQAEALVVSVAEVWLPPPSGQETADNLEVVPPTPAAVRRMWARGEAQVKQAGELAKRASKRLQHNFPGWKVQQEALTGSPAWELLRLDREWQPSLIVVGSHGRTALGRFVLGSVSQQVLTEAHCSVRVARGKTPVGEPPQRIIVGFDGSTSAMLAVSEVASRHWTKGSEVQVVVVHDRLLPSSIDTSVPPLSQEVNEGNDEARLWADKIGERAASELRKSNLSVSTIIESGDPKRVLVGHADDWGADSIFVGSTGLSSHLGGISLGSVSAAVAARSLCSVEVVRERQA